MAGAWYPLLIDNTQVNEPSNIVPDWANDKIYTFGRVAPFTGIFYTIWTSKASDGTHLASNSVSSICSISGNTFIVTPSICMGSDGAHIYAMTSHGGTSGDQQSNLRLSKIDTATMTEVAAYIPYAITNKIAEGYFIAGAGSWRLSAYKLNGVDYLALLLNGSDPANIEFINTSTLSSVISYNYTTQGGGDVHMVVGEQPTLTSQKLYLMQEDPNGNDVQIGFVAVTFTPTPTASDAILINLPATSIDASWTGSFPDVDLDPLCLMFNAKTASLCFFVLNDIDSGPHLPATSKVVQIDTVTGAVDWAVQITNDGFNVVSSFSFDQAAGLSDLSCCSLIFCDPLSTTYFTITPATGAFTTGTSPHFDNTDGGGIQQSAVWDSVRQRLLYYYEGTNDLGPSWPAGGWAVWGPDTDLGCCGTVFAGNISESASAVDADSAHLAAAVAIAETGALSDSQNGLGAKTITESAPAHDLFIATQSIRRPLWMTIGGAARDSIYPN